MSTRAISFLKQKGIPFEVLEYEHQEKGAPFASEAIEFPLEQTVKTLVADLGNRQNALVLMPGDRELSLKKLAKAFKVKRASMAEPSAAERLTGYLVGGISPFGAKRTIRAIMEKSLLAFDTVAINGGQRGVMLKLNPKDIVRAINAMVFELAE